MPRSRLESVLINIEQLSGPQRLMSECKLQKTSSMVPVSAEGVGQDGHGPVAGADVSGDVDSEPMGFERGASVDQGCGESSCK